MRADDKQRLLESFRESLQKYGDSPEAVQSRGATQRYRFQVLTEIADLETADVLDYGCGKGDLYPYLIEQGFRGQYTGYDINPDLIALARQKFPAPRFEVRDADEDAIDKQFDFVIMSGLFNSKLQDNWGMMTSVLRRTFACARRGLAFNAISTYVTFQMFERQGIRMPDLERRLLCSITTEMLRLKVGELLACRDAGGNLLAMTLFLYDSKSAYSLFGATDPAHRDSSTYTYLILENLHHCRDRAVERVDFVGINSPNRGDYKLSFNFKPTPYFLTTWEAP